MSGIDARDGAAKALDATLPWRCSAAQNLLHHFLVDGGARARRLRTRGALRAIRRGVVQKMLNVLKAHGRRHRLAYTRLAQVLALFAIASLPFARFGSRLFAGDTRIVRSPSGDSTAVVSLAGTAVADPTPTFNPIAPKRLPGTMHDLDVYAEEKTLTIAPGLVQKVWTFNGQVPGPVIRVRVGETRGVHFRTPRTTRT